MTAQASPPATEFASIAWRGRTVRVEHQWIAPERRGAPLLVFLHEGLGSVAMWKDFPERLCAAAGVRGLVFSRPAYGRSTPREADETWDVDFMHRQAHEVLPAFFEALGLTEAPWLLPLASVVGILMLFATLHLARAVGIFHGWLAKHLLVRAPVV